MDSKTWIEYEEVVNSQFQCGRYGEVSKTFYFDSVPLAQKWVKEIGNKGHEPTWVKLPSGELIAPENRSSGWEIKLVSHISGIRVFECSRDYSPVSVDDRTLLSSGGSAFPRIRRKLIDTIKE